MGDANMGDVGTAESRAGYMQGMTHTMGVGIAFGLAGVAFGLAGWLGAPFGPEDMRMADIGFGAATTGLAIGVVSYIMQRRELRLLRAGQEGAYGRGGRAP